MGEWHNGKMHGKGTLTFPPPDDGQYRGDFLDGLGHGKGTLERPFHSRPGRTVTDVDGTYTGEWFKNMRHGQGTFTSVDGTKWTGTWCKNLKDGLFTKISPDGNMVEETWRNGLLQERETAAMLESAMLSAERTRMQKTIDEEKAKVASMEMDMKRTRDRMFEREMAREREKLKIQEEQERLFQGMEEERRRMEAGFEKKYRELSEQFARDRQEAEQKNTKLIEQMSTLHSSTANLKAERRSGIIVANYNKKVQENRSEFLTCVQNLAKVKTPNLSIGLVGRTSSGKSSLLNRMFGTTCKVGATRCTTGVEEVWRYEDPDIHKGISVWDVFGFNDEAYESIETINTFVSLHAVLLLYRDDIHSCKNTIELFRAADVKVIVVRSQIDTLTPEELQEIEQVEAPKAKEYGACHWTKTTTKSGTSADDLKKYILSLPSARAGTEDEQGNNIETPETVHRHRDSACNSGNTSPLQMEPAHSFVAAGGQAAQEQADAALVANSKTPIVTRPTQVAVGDDDAVEEHGVQDYLSVIESPELDSKKTELITAMLRLETRPHVLKVFSERAMWRGQGEKGYFHGAPEDWSCVVAALGSETRALHELDFQESTAQAQQPGMMDQQGMQQQMARPVCVKDPHQAMREFELNMWLSQVPAFRDKYTHTYRERERERERERTV
jgi:GTP-binding protein EngB required for normal cell division